MSSAVLEGLSAHPENGRSLVIGNQCAGRHLVDKLGGEHDADDRQRSLSPVDDGADRASRVETVRIGKAIAEKHLVIAVRLERASTAEMNPVSRWWSRAGWRRS